VDNNYLAETIDPADEIKMELINNLKSLSLKDIKILSEKFSDLLSAIKDLKNK
jgi:hypothetical protein